MTQKRKVEMDWHGEEVVAKLQKVHENIVQALALEVEGQTKLNIDKPFEHADGEVRGQVDTGAMINSVRAEFGRIPDAGPNTIAAVNVAVEYAAYQEHIRPFLYPAVEEITSKADGFIAIESKRQGVT